MIYEIEPLDNYFFRNSAPFEAGGETFVSQGEFPPLPSAYAGAFKTLTTNSINSARCLKIGYNGLMLGETFYFPMPQDLYALGEKTAERWELSSKCLDRSPLSNYPFRYMLRVQNSPKDKAQPLLYLAEDDIHRYLQSDIQGIVGVDVNGSIMKETKLGIGIDYVSGTSKNQQLYNISCIRPKLKSGMKLAVEINSDLVKECGVIKLGGEDKKARFKPAVHELNQNKYESNSKYFKLYLATPSIFSHGWLPGWLDEETKMGYFAYKGKRVTVKLLSACIGRSVPCGGFGKVPGEKEVQYRPREMKYAVPAGSVYYFQLLEGSYNDAVRLFHGKCISDYREKLGFNYQVFNRSRYCDRGFGYSLVGTLNKDQEEMLNVR